MSENQNQDLNPQENEGVNIIEELLHGATDIAFTDKEAFILKKFREKADLKLLAKLFIATEQDKVRKHIRLLKKTNSFYEELNKDLSSAKSEKETISILGENSELVQMWKRYCRKD